MERTRTLTTQGFWVRIGFGVVLVLLGALRFLGAEPGEEPGLFPISFLGPFVILLGLGFVVSALVRRPR